VDRGSSKIAVWAKQKALGRNLLRKAAILNRIRLQDAAAKKTYEGLGRSFVEQEKEQRHLELAKLAFVYGSHDIHAAPLLERVPPFPPMQRLNSRRPELDPSKPTAGDTKTGDEPTSRSPNDAYATSFPHPKTGVSRKTNFPLSPSPLGLSNYDAFDMEDDIPDPYSHFDYDDVDEDPSDVGKENGYRLNTPPVQDDASVPHVWISPALTASKTPPQVFYSDFSILDPGEPVVGDYDQIDEGLWPNVLIAGPQPPTPASKDAVMGPSSSSPNFPALFATSAGGGSG
jgi:hypothetical protein